MKQYNVTFNPHVSCLTEIECPYCEYKMDIPVNDPFYTVFICQGTAKQCCRPFVINIITLGDGHEVQAFIQCLRIEGVREFVSEEVMIDIPDPELDDFAEESPIFDDE